MYKKTITWTDFEGEERTEDFYFNLSEAEITKMELSEVGGLRKKIETVVQAKDVPSIMNTFEDIIKASYGVKSPDGRRFIKSKEIYDDFAQTEAYSQFFMQICSDADEAAKFVNGIIPAKLKAQMEEKPNLLTE